MPFLRIGDLVHHYAVGGAKNGPALVFSNSLGTDLRIWDAVVPYFVQDFRIVRYDLRGHGLADAPPPPYAMDDLVRDLVGLLDALTIAEAAVCGLSVGGMIAQGLAAAHPDRVRAVVLCDTGTRIGPPKMWNERIAGIEAGGLCKMAGPIMERWFTRAFRERRVAELRGYSNMLVRTPAQGYIGVCCALRDADLREAARSIRTPALVLCGEQDVATPPEIVRALAGAIPGAQFFSIGDAGHLPCIEQPEALARRMKEFFKETRIV